MFQSNYVVYMSKHYLIGSNWMYETLMRILTKTAEPIQGSKEDAMIEFQSAESVDKLLSPRIVNCHFPCRYVCMCFVKPLVTLFVEQLYVRILKAILFYTILV
jgi:hypothetical protein